MLGGFGDDSMRPRIVDIRSDAASINLKQEIKAGLKSKDGDEKTLPTLLLYDDRGLKLFEKITYLDEYYLTEDEISVLTAHADKIADRIPHGALVVELGSGCVIETSGNGDGLFIDNLYSATFGRSRSCWMLWTGPARA